MAITYSTTYSEQSYPHSTSYTAPRYSTDLYTSIKMERQSSDQDDRLSPSYPGIPIATVMTANENWRGKNDPAERRRIQNRLNQRAFRKRQRAGESPKHYKPRSGSSTKSDTRTDEDDDDDDDDDDEEEEESEDEADSPQSETSQPSPSNEGQTSSGNATQVSMTNTEADRRCDELARIINRNFMTAAVANAQLLGIDLAVLRCGTAVKTPRTTNRQLPATLTPVQLQYQVPHDPIIDVIPHARLRFNVLRAIATHQVEAADFSKSIRASGALENHNGNWLRGGLVVWNDGSQPANWELSEPWRSRRGERLFPLTFGQS